MLNQKRTFLATCMLALVAGCCLAAPRLETYSMGGIPWKAESQIEVEAFKDGVVRGYTSGNDPIFRATKLKLNADEIPAFRVRLAVKGSKNAQLFFDPLSEKRSYRFALVGDGKMRDYILPMQDHPEWKGKVTGLRLDPAEDSLAEIAFGGVFPDESSKGRLELWNTQSDLYQLAENAELDLSFTVVNTGAKISPETQLNIQASGIVADLKTLVTRELPVLPPGESVTTRTIRLLGTGQDGRLNLKINHPFGEDADLKVEALKPEVLSHEEGLKAEKSLIADFSDWQQNTSWTSTEEDIRVTRSFDLMGCSFGMNQTREIFFYASCDGLKDLLFCASSFDGVTAEFLYRRKDETLVSQALRLTPKAEFYRLSVPEDCETLVSLRLHPLKDTKTARADIFRLSTSGDKPGFILKGEGMIRSLNPTVDRLIFVSGKSLDLKMNQPYDGMFSVSWTDVRSGAGNTVGEEKRLFSFTKSMKDKLDIPDGDKMIGPWDLQIETDQPECVMTRRVVIVQDAKKLEALRQIPKSGAILPLVKADIPQTQTFAEYSGKMNPDSDAVMQLLETELSPAWMLKVKSESLHLFSELTHKGPALPSKVAWATADGVKTRDAKGEMSLKDMTQPWLIAWFAAAEGWDRVDMPVLVVLTRKPDQLEVLKDSWKISFPEQCGEVFFMPLYGNYRPPQKGKDILVEAGLPPRGIETWTWDKSPSEDAVERAGFWSRVFRRYPVDVSERFVNDPKSGDVSIRYKFEYLDVPSEWNVPPLTLAPLSPMAGFAFLPASKLPVETSPKVKDLDFMTPYGPLFAAEGEELELKIKNVGRMINEIELPVMPGEDQPGVAVALNRLRSLLKERFERSPEYVVEFDDNLFVWALLAEQIYPRVSMYVGDELSARVRAAMAEGFHNFFFGTGEDPANGDRGWWQHTFKGRNEAVTKYLRDNFWVIDGPGIHGGLMTDSGKIAASGAVDIWNYVYYSGDHALASDRWTFIKKLETNSITQSWKIMGRHQNAESGEHMPPRIAQARLAYLVGDLEHYHFASYLLARELIMMNMKIYPVGTEYFRLRQPYGGFQEIMPDWALPSHTLGEAAGVMIDKDGYWPVIPGETQAQNRWVRMNCPDSARFYSEYYPLEIRKELDAMLAGKINHTLDELKVDKVHGLPSMMRLDALLLGTRSETLSRKYPIGVWGPDETKGGPGTAAECWARLRAAVPIVRTRLIPSEVPKSPELEGIQRHPVSTWRGMLCFMWPEKKEANWPRTRWFRRGGNMFEGGKFPHLTLGRISPGEKLPKEMNSDYLNGVTRLTEWR